MDYPLDIVNVSQGFIMFDERVTFAGVFARPNSVKKADFSRSIYAFHWSIYLLIASYLVLFAVVFKARSYMRMWMRKSIIVAVHIKPMHKNRTEALLRRMEKKSEEVTWIL